jgi:sensor histidine kinase regulating citrate/malate metabolism
MIVKYLVMLVYPVFQLKGENMKLQYKILIFMTAILISTLGIVCVFSFYEMQENVKEQMSRNVLNTASAISGMQDIQDAIGNPRDSDKIQEIIERIRLKTKVQFITVMDMEGIRKSHPMSDKIGKRFSGGDEERCLKYGQTYITEGEGSLGKSLRAFVPIYKDGVQVGAVCVGILIGDLNREFMLTLKRFIPYIIVGLSIGVLGSLILSYSIKKTIFGLEPREVAANLRAQNHEFMNKLHTISGLIQLEEYDKAVEFIHDTSKLRNDVLEVLDNIKNASLTGLLLSKYNKAVEAKIEFEIDASSSINKLPDNVGENDLICIVGNLIENSIDAVIGRKNGKIYFLIEEEENKITIKVSNNGEPIPHELRESIFERGVTTKKGIRGFGLNNVKQIVSSLGGQISFTSAEETTWNIKI